MIRIFIENKKTNKKKHTRINKKQNKKKHTRINKKITKKSKKQKIIKHTYTHTHTNIINIINIIINKKLFILLY